jgi:hypothetical protein
MLEGWHEFYELLGTAAAALLALLFVAASIGASVLTPGRSRATRTYLSPIVFHYAVILLASLIALIPTQTPLWLGISMGSVALIGMLYSLFVCFQLFRDHVADIADLLGYGGFPAAAYAAALISAFLFKNQPAAAINVVAGHGASGGQHPQCVGFVHRTGAQIQRGARQIRLINCGDLLQPQSVRPRLHGALFHSVRSSAQPDDPATTAPMAPP